MLYGSSFLRQEFYASSRKLRDEHGLDTIIYQLSNFGWYTVTTSNLFYSFYSVTIRVGIRFNKKSSIHS